MRLLPMWKRLILMTLLGTSLLSCANAEPGDRKRLGKAGEWINTVAGTVIKNQLYTIETSGLLYSTDLKTGVWKQVGKGKFAKPRFLMTAGPNLYAVLGDNSFYAITPATGAKKRVGATGSWKGVIKATGLNGQIYVVTAKGGLYCANLVNGKMQKLGKDEFANTVIIANHEKAQYSPIGLFTIEKDGSLYSVNPVNGTWKLVGKNGIWSGSKLGAIIADIDQRYVVTNIGALKYGNLSYAEGGPLAVGKPVFQRTIHLFATSNALYALDSDGSLYAVELPPSVG